MSHKNHLVVLSGAGISAESGLKTFRDSDGLWEGYFVDEVATPAGWRKNPRLVLDFYNARRRDVMAAKPNTAHKILAELESAYNVSIITQNIDDLHERAGSTKVLHLHGEIMYSRSSLDPELKYRLQGWEMKEGARCEKGSPLRPDVVWFGEAVPLMEQAIMLVRRADIFLVVGTSLAVYPAASLVDYAPLQARCFLVDPRPAEVPGRRAFTVIRQPATSGLFEFRSNLLRLAV